MRFFVDRCAGHRLAEWLRQQGHDVAESQERGPDPGDQVVLKWATDEGRVLVTMDKDFGTLIFKEGAYHCGLVRLPDIPAGQRIALMETILIRHTKDLLERSIVTVQGKRIRISHLPPIEWK